LFKELDTHTRRGYPLFWVVKDKNIIITRGKTGTRTLLRVCDYSSEDTTLKSNQLMDMLENGYRLHFVIREPADRFRSGILEDWEHSMHYSLTEINKVSDNDWDDVVNKFVLAIVKERQKYPNSRQFHTGNWLSDVETVTSAVTNAHYWKLSDLPELLKQMACSYEYINTTALKGEYNKQFLEAYDRLPESTMNLVKQYLQPDIEVYKRIFK
jgi:hypothetical protein